MNYFTNLRIKYVSKKEDTIRLKCHELILKKCFIYAYKLFPQYDLNTIDSIASETAIKLLDYDTYNKEDNKLVTDNYFKQILKLEKKVLKKDSNIKYYLSQYYIVSTYYYSLFGKKLAMKKMLKYFRKAKHYNNTVQTIRTVDGMNILLQNIKSNLRLVDKEIKNIRKNIINQKKSEHIKPIKIKSSKVLFFITLASTLFFLSGIIYIKLFYYILEFDTSPFYSITDYLSNSLNMIIELSIIIILTFIFLFYRFITELDNDIIKEQLKINSESNTRNNKILYIIIVGTSLNAILYFYLLGEIPSVFLFPLILIILLQLLEKVKFETYIKNHMDIYAICFILILFFTNLVFKVFNEVEQIRAQDFKSNYKVIFKTKNLYNDYELFNTSSGFLFFINPKNQDIIVIPTHEIKYIKKIKKEESNIEN